MLLPAACLKEESSTNNASDCDLVKQGLLSAFLKRAFNTDSSLCKENKASPCSGSEGGKENSYRKELGRKVMKPDFIATIEDELKTRTERGTGGGQEGRVFRLR